MMTVGYLVYQCDDRRFLVCKDKLIFELANKTILTNKLILANKLIFPRRNSTFVQIAYFVHR